MEEEVDLLKATQAIKEAGVHDQGLCREDILDIYRAIKNSETHVTFADISLKEGSEELSLNKYPDGIEIGGTASASRFRETRKAHYNPIIPNWKYIPLLCTDKYLKASIDDRVQILLEDFETSRRHRLELASRSFIRASLPPPIDLLAINSSNSGIPIFPKRVLPRKSMKRKSAIKSFENADKNDENPPYDILKSASEDHTTSMVNSWKNTIPIEQNNPKMNDSDLFKRFIKRRKRNNESQESASEAVSSTLNSMNGKNNIDNHEIPSNNLDSNSSVKIRNNNKNITEKSVVMRNSKVEDESNIENQKEKDYDDLLGKDSVQCRKIVKKRGNKLKPLTENNENEDQSKITIISVHTLQEASESTGKKQCSQAITPKKLFHSNPLMPIPTSREMLTDNFQNAKKGDQTEIDKFQKSLNEITIDNHTDDEEMGSFHYNSFGGVKNALNRTEVDKQCSPTITSKKLIHSNPPMSVPMKKRDQANIHKFNKSTNEIAIDNHTDDKQGQLSQSYSFGEVNTAWSTNEVEKQYSPTMKFLTTGAAGKRSCLFHKSPKQVPPTRCEMLFDNLKKESIAKEREQAKLDRFKESLNEITILEEHTDDEEEEKPSSNWFGDAKTGLNRNEDSTAAKEKVKTVLMDVDESEPCTSTIQKTDCPFCGKWLSISVIQHHVAVCERLHTTMS